MCEPCMSQTWGMISHACPHICFWPGFVDTFSWSCCVEVKLPVFVHELGLWGVLSSAAPDTMPANVQVGSCRWSRPQEALPRCRQTDVG